MKDTPANVERFIKYLKLLSEGKTYEEIGALEGTGKNAPYRIIKFYKEKYKINHTITKYDYLKINGDMDKIVEKYLSGTSSIDLGIEYQVSDCTVVEWLIKEGVNIRNRGTIPITDQSIFTVIDSEIKAYTIGLLTADGSIGQGVRGGISLSLAHYDGYLLQQINERLLNNTGHYFISHLNYSSRQPLANLRFWGKTIKEDLSKYGIIPNKTYSLKGISLLIPEEFYHHYIRGLYDGDGVCSYYTHHKRQRVRIGYCAKNYEMTESYRNFLVDKIGLTPNLKLFNTGGCWQCSWSKTDDLKKFYDYIYKDATIFLGRKKKKLFDYVNTEVTKETKKS